MPRRPRICINCGDECRGTRCRACANTHGVRNYKYDPAPVVVVETVKVEPSWWTKAARENFTETAQKNVVPTEDTKVRAYNWQVIPL